MHDYVRKVRLLANEIVDKSNHVKIDKDSILEFLKYYNRRDFGLETSPNQQVIDNDKDKFIFELYACAINYCFWYGRYDIRPFKSSSTELYRLITRAFYYHKTEKVDFFSRIKIELRDKRFPMIEERCNHIDEIYYWQNTALKILNIDDPNILFESLVKNTSCYGSDLFLKRVQLLFIQLYRRFGLYEEFVNELTVPADYQIPKILHAKGILEYSKELTNKIMTNSLLQKGSIEEIEIRASTIVACDMIAKEVDLPVHEIDQYLFNMSRDLSSSTPFHLTITTDY